jgi:hypothetical protein
MEYYSAANLENSEPDSDEKIRQLKEMKEFLSWPERSELVGTRDAQKLTGSKCGSCSSCGGGGGSCGSCAVNEFSE